jgi:hypothetical protein
MTRQTQLDAWIDLQNKLPARRKAVLEALILHPKGLTCIELSEALRWPINCVSGRLTELYKAGFIREVGTRPNPESGKQCTVWADNRPVNLF